MGVLSPVLRPALFRPWFRLPSFLAEREAGFWADFTRPTTLFQGTDETTPVTTFGNPIGRANDQRVGPGSPISITQATPGSRPLWQANGAEFNGTAHNLLTNFAAGAGANTLIARVLFPASIGAFNYALGAVDGTGITRFGLGLNTDGTVGFAWGGTSPAVAKGTSDVRGSTAVVALSSDGTTVRGFVGNAVEYQAAASGIPPTTTVPVRLGGLNSNGTPANFLACSISSAVGWRGGGLLDLARFQQIANALGG